MVVVRPYVDEDYEAVYRLRRLAFGGPHEPPPPTVDPPGGSSALVAHDDSGLAGYLRVWGYRQFFGGRAVPMGGVASVSVAPHARGSGVAGKLLTDALALMREQGQGISALYPYVIPPYRRHGWEHVGTMQTALVTLSDLAGTPRSSVPVRPATDADLDAIHACYLRTASTIDGMLDRATPAFTLSRVLELDVVTVAPGPDGLRGYLTAARPDGKRLRVYDLIADDVDTAHALLRQLGSWSGGITDANVRLVDYTLLDLTVPGGLQRGLEMHDFMLRVVDLPVAVAARGWPAVAESKPFSVDIEINDPHAPWQAGRWRLIHEDGAVTAEPGGSGEVRLEARALGPWYAGSATATSLRKAGLLVGPREAAIALDRLTGAPHPVHLAESF
ncbi:GNAT family N-acetyltransferase [Actinokineospora cianjurensis]|uniref:Putative acetyltransferase n=1 Tax=Actinokineospora cianjurensis TaxID=585224 RepID=A0A421B5C9_9PSEU|nr:GNAT family N-acetyltransferase [Actinokineospora cianjurensis]RLK59587.1 putative acetyltransferase [Actinokineospora cianjurensis]